MRLHKTEIHRKQKYTLVLVTQKVEQTESIMSDSENKNSVTQPLNGSNRSPKIKLTEWYFDNRIRPIAYEYNMQNRPPAKYCDDLIYPSNPMYDQLVERQAQFRESERQAKPDTRQVWQNEPARPF